MDHVASLLLLLGGLLLVGLVTDLLGRRTPLPRVTMLLLVGLICGPSVLGWLPDLDDVWLEGVASIALLMVGFLLGGALTRKTLHRRGRAVLAISVATSVGTFGVVWLGLLAAGVDGRVAALLGAIATATDAVSTSDVVREVDARGPFSETLLGIVAIDDAWGLLVFSLVMAVVQAVSGGGHGLEALGIGFWEIVGAVALGIALGVPMAALTGRLRPGEPTQAEALGLVLLCGGLAQWLEVSYLLAAMVMGAVVANRAHHHRRPFHAIEGIEWPFLILFFVLAGSSLRIAELWAAGLLGIGYVALRVVGRVAGAWLGGRTARMDGAASRWMGVALLPQAGVALGMALVAVQRAPELMTPVLSVVIGACVVFEVTGPVLQRLALDRAGEVGSARSAPAGSGPRAPEGAVTTDRGSPAARRDG